MTNPAARKPPWRPVPSSPRRSSGDPRCTWIRADPTIPRRAGGPARGARRRSPPMAPAYCKGWIRLCEFLPLTLRNYGVPLHLIREMYETFCNFRIHVSDYARHRKITSNMNGRFLDAIVDELNASDATCIICRQEMTTANKLLCGHLFW